MKHFDSYFVFFFAYHPLKFLRLQKGLKAISSPWRNGVVTNIFLIYRTINNVLFLLFKTQKDFCMWKTEETNLYKIMFGFNAGIADFVIVNEPRV